MEWLKYCDAKRKSSNLYLVSLLFIDTQLCTTMFWHDFSGHLLYEVNTVFNSD